MLPDYIAKSKPNPVSNRAPWYTNTAPTYAGIFLWVVFYKELAVGTISQASLSVCLLALAVAGLLCYALYYLSPAMFGMKTGYPLYVIGSSTFGTTGGYVMPGLLMGLLQIGWFAVGTNVSATFILNGFGMDSSAGTPLFWAICIVWGYVMCWIGAAGIQYVAKVSTWLNALSAIVVLIVFLMTMGGLSQHQAPAQTDNAAVFTMILGAVIGFFATAGAAGTDFGMNNRNASDVKLGGFVGIALAVLYAGGLPLLSVAGARASNPAITSFTYDAVLASLGGVLASSAFFFFAIASIPPACFCALIAGNSFSTMIPGVKRLSSMLVGVTVAIVLAGTGVAANLAAVFGLVGASFGPICGAMSADYLLSGRKWSGPREGINLAGYTAWAVGFLIGINDTLPIGDDLHNLLKPAVVWSYIAGFVIYAALAKMGMQPKVVSDRVQTAGA
jgi:cytosine permease